MKRHVLVLMLIMLAAGCAQAVELPERCLWIEAGQVQARGDLRLPPELLAAAHVGMLKPLSPTLLLWTVEDRDDTGQLRQFSLSFADLKTGLNRRQYHTLDPFGLGTDWVLQRASLLPSGKAVLLKVRMSGTGGFTSVYKLMLTPPYYHYEMPEDTQVWDSASADVKAFPTWQLTTDWRTAPNERQARFATIVVLGKSTPGGRRLFAINRFTEIADYAQEPIDHVAVSPDGRSVAYANPRGLWLARVTGGQPQLLLPEGASPAYVYADPAWAPDGSVVYITRTAYPDDKRETGIYAVDPTAPGRAELVRPNAWGLAVMPST